MGAFIIGIADQKVIKFPEKVSTLGLGSCVGLVLYDSVNKIGGMVHIMLPSAPSGVVPNKSKFADTGIVKLIRCITTFGARQRNLQAKLAGGAHMFNNSYNTDIMNVGKRNVEMCQAILKKYTIPIISEDVGGKSGRSIEFCCSSCMLQVRTVSPKSVRFI